ncbi:RNA polymerase sigma factor [Coprothermobacteraceae bacterium]|nr:RNA polymerase sigma factor [Coprothermobacteraceae bacterium]
MRRLGLSEAEAEDGVQEVFVRAINSKIDWHAPKGYLFSIAHNWAMDTMKARHDSLDDSELLEPNNEKRFQDLHLLLQSLSQEERSIILLLYQEGLSYREVAEMVGKPENTVKSIAHRAKERLRKEV